VEAPVSRPFVALLLLAVALAPACSEPPPAPTDPIWKDVEVTEEVATQEWVANLPDGWRAALAAIQATAAAYDYIADAPTRTLETPEGLKQAEDRVDLAQDAVRRLESFGVNPPDGIALGYREYSTTAGPFVPGRRYYSKLLSEADLSRSGINVIVRFDESMGFANQGTISDSLALYANRDGAVEFFSMRRRLVARTRGFLGGRRSFLASLEFIDPYRKIASPVKKSSVEDLVREIKR
jgi:hypothetical protein